MQKLKSILKNIKPKKVLKYIILMFGFFFLSGFLMHGSVCYGQIDTVGLNAGLNAAVANAVNTTTTTTNTDSTSALTSQIFLMNSILKIAYVVLWPLLVIAGASLDNALVYGSVFGLDIPLWKFWNIMKNFANFTLGFLVLFQILKGLFTMSESAVSEPMKAIKSALIAGVLIQASRFLLGAVIDVSTIATIGIGGIPLSVLKGSELGDRPILGVNSDFTLEQLGEQLSEEKKGNGGFKVTYSYAGEDKEISRCKTAEVGNSNFILGREYFYCKGGDKPTPVVDECAPNICVLNGKKIVPITEVNGVASVAGGIPDINLSNSTNHKIQLDKLLTYMNGQKDILNAKKYPEGRATCITEKCGEIKVFKPEEKTGEVIPIELNTVAIDNYSKARFKQRIDNNDGMTLSKIITKLKGYTGPLVTLYSSLMNFAEIADLDTKNDAGGLKEVGGMWIKVMIKIVFALALIIPLLMLGVVLIARVGYLWLIIAFMPLLILKWLFFEKEKSGVFAKVPDVGDLVGIIFSPVVVTFALSICLIFLSAINGMIDNPQQEQEFYSRMNVYQSGGQFDIGQFGVQFKSDDTSAAQIFSDGKTMFSWLIVNLFAVALVWAILFAAIKSNKLGEDVVAKFKGIDEFLGNALMSMPIYKTTGANGEKISVGLGGIAGALEGAPARMTQNMSNENIKAAEALFDKYGVGNIADNTPTPTIEQLSDTYKGMTVGTHYSDNNGSITLTPVGEEYLKTKNISKENMHNYYNYSQGNAVQNIIDGTRTSQGNNKIDPSKVVGMSNLQVESALNHKQIDAMAGSNIATAEGTFTIAETKKGSGIFTLNPIKDDNGTHQQDINKIKEDLKNAASDIKKLADAKTALEIKLKAIPTT